MHLFASNIIVNRLSFNHLDNTSLKSIVTPSIEHKFSKEMTQKSTIVSLPILNCNENNYHDCVTILRTYEKWIFEIYQKAGLINQYPYLLQNPNLPDPPICNPGQPGAHALPTSNDPMYSIKIPFAGDQLTRVRFAGAKDLLAGAHTPPDRFEHFYPFKPVMFHTKASFLQYCYSLLHHPESANQVGTLKYFREKLNRKNVTPNKVLDSYDDCEELFVSLGKAYITVALMIFFKMESIDDYPTAHCFENNMIHKAC